MSGRVPPPPPGFVLDGGGGAPPPPPGFVLDSDPHPAAPLASNAEARQGRSGIIGGALDFAEGLYDTGTQPAIDLAKAMGRKAMDPKYSENGMLGPAHAGWDLAAEMFFGAQKASEEQFKAAFDLGQKKTYRDMSKPERMEQDARFAAGFLPMVGPAAAKAGEKLGTPGQRARGAGEATGIIGQALLPAVVRGKSGGSAVVDAEALAKSRARQVKAVQSAIPDMAKGAFKSAAVELAMHSMGLGGLKAIPAAYKLYKLIRGGTAVADAIEAVRPTMAPEAPPVIVEPASVPNGPVRPVAGFQGTSATPMIPEHMPLAEPRLTVPAPPPRPAPVVISSGSAPLEPVYIPSDPLQPWRGAPEPARPTIKGPMAESPNTKPPTIYQPEGTHYTARHPDATQPPVKARDLPLIDKQLEALGDQENPLFGKSRVPQKEGPPPPETKPDLGKVAAAKHSEQVAMAREASKKDPSLGPQIWMELDANGKPVRVVSPAKAGSLKRQGIATTWIKNMWGDPDLMFRESH